MLPLISQNNMAHGSASNSEIISKPFVRVFKLGVHLSCPSYLFFRELCLSVFRSNKTATFLNHVSNIIFACSSKKMRWPNTRWIIALMKNPLATRDSSEVHSIEESVRKKGFGTAMNLPVASCSFAANPQPAGLGLFNVMPWIFCRLSWFHVGMNNTVAK